MKLTKQRLKEIIKEEIQKLNEKKELDSKTIQAVAKMTQSNNHTLARFQLAKYMGNNRLSKFYTAMEQLNDVFGGYGPELNKLNQKMEKVLYKELKRTFANADIIKDAL